MGSAVLKARHSLTAADRQDLAIGGLVCLLTYVVSLYYTGGDQAGYGEAYRAVRGIDPALAFNIYERFISTVEFLHFVLVYIASNFLIDKNIFFSMLNGLFAIACVRAMRTMEVNIFLAMSFVFTNYYFYVCYFAAERLKIALLFFIVGIFTVSKLGRYFWYVLSIMSHVTVMLLLAGRILQKVVILCRWRQGAQAKSVAELAFFVFAIFLSIYYFGDYAFWKFQQYYELADNNLRSAIPILVYVAISLYYAEKKSEVFIDFIPIALAFTVLGSRINMFAYFAFLKYGLRVNYGINVGIASTSLYFAYKSALFLNTVFNTGQAF